MNRRQDKTLLSLSNEAQRQCGKSEKKKEESNLVHFHDGLGKPLTTITIKKDIFSTDTKL